MNYLDMRGVLLYIDLDQGMWYSSRVAEEDMAKFSVTELGTFRRCRQQWIFGSKGQSNLTSIGAGPEQLELGSLVHRALANWIMMDKEEQQQPGTLAMLFLETANARKQELKDTYKEEKQRELPEVYLDSLLNVVTLGTHMMNNYQMFHKTPIPSNMTVAFPEQQIEIDVPGTEYQCSNCRYNWLGTKGVGSKVFMFNSDCKECGGKGYLYHQLTATLDGLLQDDKGFLWVLEHKTYENRPTKMGLFMNDQFTGYAWVLQQLNMGKLGGIAYDGMWKRQGPPKYMQKEKRPGRIDDLFIRMPIPKPKMMLDVWGENLAKLVNEMANDPEIYPNVPWQGCSDCFFIEPCYMQMNGEDISTYMERNFMQREIIRGGAL